MTTSDDGRPRPQYGEYATPQEQAKAIAKSAPVAPSGEQADADNPAPAAGAAYGAAGPVAPRSTAAPTSAPAAPSKLPAPLGPAPLDPAPRDPAAPPRASVNRMVTVALLAVGLVYLIGGAGSYLALPDTLDTLYQQWKIGSYAATSFASTIGIAVIVSQAAIWLLIAFLSVRRLRKGRSSWWLPLIGAVATVIVTAIFMAIVITSDPAFMAYLTRS